jgi:hypothetical protein
LIAIVTTEHYNLQSGRAATIAEANGRATLFVGAVSSGLVALALVAQLSRLGTAFYAFSLVVLPTLTFMGLITFERVLQSLWADYMYSVGLYRIHQLYLRHAPQLRPYLIFSAPALLEETRQQPATRPFWRQSFFTVAAMIAVLNSVLIGSFIGLLCSALDVPLWTGAGAGIAAFLLSEGLHQRHQWAEWRAVLRTVPDPPPGTMG